ILWENSCFNILIFHWNKHIFPMVVRKIWKRNAGAMTQRLSSSEALICSCSALVRTDTSVLMNLEHHLTPEHISYVWQNRPAGRMRGFLTEWKMCRPKRYRWALTRFYEARKFYCWRLVTQRLRQWH